MKRSLLAIIAGVTLTALLTVIGMSQNSREAVCTYIWQACLVQLVVRTPDNPLHEGSPIDFFGFVLGVLAGVPIYSFTTYIVLTIYARLRKARS